VYPSSIEGINGTIEVPVVSFIILLEVSLFVVVVVAPAVASFIDPSGRDCVTLGVVVIVAMGVVVIKLPFFPVCV
jgi:hypothetical protein